MQQTNKYKLNLIEKDDVFSPDALNENAQKVETALEAVSAQAAAGDQAEAAARGALAQRVTALEAHHIVVGSYTGNGSTVGQTISLGFTPVAMLVGKGGTAQYLLTPENPSWYSMGYTEYYLQIVAGGFQVASARNTTTDQGWNTMNQKYYFLAFV